MRLVMSCLMKVRIFRAVFFSHWQRKLMISYPIVSLVNYLYVAYAFNSHALTNIAWALAVSKYDLTLMSCTVFSEELLARQKEFNSEITAQLYRWHLWQTKEKGNDGLPKPIQDKCKQIFLSADTKLSALPKDVVCELKDLNLSPVEEYLTPSGYSLDALVEIKGTKIAVEVDGPSHFIDREPNGSTLLKRMQVGAIDEIPFVSIPYVEWDNFGKDEGKKQQFLQSMFESKLML